MKTLQYASVFHFDMLRFLNCLSCKNNKDRKLVESTNLIRDSHQSVDELQTPSYSMHDSHSNKRSSQNGSTKETLSLSTVSHFNNSHCLMDAHSLNLGQDDIGASKMNLLPSESCSVIMKQSTDRISASDHSEIFKRLDIVVKRLERLLLTDNAGKSPLL